MHYLGSYGKEFVCLFVVYEYDTKKGSYCTGFMGSTLGQEGPASIRFELRLLFTLLRKKPFAKNILKLAFFCVMHKKQTSFIHIHINEKYIISFNG